MQVCSFNNQVLSLDAFAWCEEAKTPKSKKRQAVSEDGSDGTCTVLRPSCSTSWQCSGHACGRSHQRGRRQKLHQGKQKQATQAKAPTVCVLACWALVRLFAVTCQGPSSRSIAKLRQCMELSSRFQFSCFGTADRRRTLSLKCFASAAAGRATPRSS